MTILHLDDAAESDVPVTTSTFPDGQPHVAVDPIALRETVARLGPVEVLASVKDAGRVVTIALVLDAVRSVLGDDADVALTLTYLLGARMDRRIGPGQPATLHVLGAMLRPHLAGLRAVRILDPHSPVALEVFPGAEAMVPDALVALAVADMERRTGARPVIVIPDRGAVARTSSILARIGGSHDVARCTKKRDSETGVLSGFALEEGDVGARHCLVVDDICDGGGTFSGIAGVLRGAGAVSVSLCVTHGIFSRGIAIPGVDASYCTDSYGLPAEADGYRARREGELLAYARDDEPSPVLRVRTGFVGEVLRTQGR